MHLGVPGVRGRVGPEGDVNYEEHCPVGNLRYNFGSWSQRSECAERPHAYAGAIFPERPHAYARAVFAECSHADARAVLPERPYADAWAVLPLRQSTWLLLRYRPGGPDQCNWHGWSFGLL